MLARIDSVSYSDTFLFYRECCYTRHHSCPLRVVRPNFPHSVKTRINGPCARTPELPFLVKSGFFSFLLSRWWIFLVCFPPLFHRRGIFDYMAHGSFIRAFTAVVTPMRTGFSASTKQFPIQPPPHTKPHHSH